MARFNQFEEGKKYYEAQPSIFAGSPGKAAISGVRKLGSIGKNAFDATRMGQDLARQNEIRRQRRQDPRDAAKPFVEDPTKLSMIGQRGEFGIDNSREPTQRNLANIGFMRESNIGKQGEFVTDNDGKPSWQGLEGGWMRNEETGETYAVGANRGDKMRKVNNAGQIVQDFQEKPELRGLQNIGSNTSPYEITDSSWTPEETNRFNRTPVHGGTRARSGPGFSSRPENGWGPDYNKSPAEDLMPRFEAPGQSGEAAQATIALKQDRWRRDQKKFQSVRDLKELGEVSETKRTLMNIGAQQELTNQEGIIDTQKEVDKKRIRQEDLTREDTIRQKKITREDTKEVTKNKKLDKKQKQDRYDKYVKQFGTPEIFKQMMPKEYDETTLPSFVDGDDLSHIKPGEKILLNGEIIIRK